MSRKKESRFSQGLKLLLLCLVGALILIIFTSKKFLDSSFGTLFYFLILISTWHFIIKGLITGRAELRAGYAYRKSNPIIYTIMMFFLLVFGLLLFVVFLQRILK